MRVRGTWDGEEEARATCDDIEAYHRRGEALNGMAVLVRAGFQTREFEDRLVTLGVPYRVIGGPRFYERQEIRDAIAYLRVIAQPDDDLAFERIVNVPKRKIGPAAMRAVHGLARADGCSLTVSAARLVTTDEVKPAARRTLAALLDDFARWRGLMDAEPHAQLARLVLDESGYTEMWQTSRAPEAPGRLENLKELVAAMAEFDTLGGFLEHVSLVMENHEAAGDDKVTLMTLHSAKGLEFDTVFLPGWEERLFPHQRALDDGGAAALEEERRLAYVGLTRARRRAVISYATSRRVYGTWQSQLPSRFIAELPDEDVAVMPGHGIIGQDASSQRTAIGSYFLRGEAWRPAEPRRPAPLLEGVSYAVVPRVEPGCSFEAGQRVFHQKFGYGQVTQVDGDKLEVAFDKAGTKKVMHSFVEAA